MLLHNYYGFCYYDFLGSRETKSEIFELGDPVLHTRNMTTASLLTHAANVREVMTFAALHA